MLLSGKRFLSSSVDRHAQLAGEVSETVKLARNHPASGNTALQG